MGAAGTELRGWVLKPMTVMTKRMKMMMTSGSDSCWRASQWRDDATAQLLEAQGLIRHQTGLR